MKSSRIALIPLLFLCSCATILPGNDPVLVNAERTAQSSHQVLDLLFTVERDNEAVIKRTQPKIHDAVNSVRRKAPAAEDNLQKAIDAYRDHRDAQHKADLGTYLATLQALLDIASDYTKQIQSLNAP